MERAIEKSVTVALPRAEAWRRWTTREGLQTFFGPDCAIELWPLTPFHVWFFPENPPGARGAEELVLLSLLPERMLSFQWDAPPHLPAVRAHRNWVVVEFADAADGATSITLHHLGWRDGAQWDQAYAYFEQAWDVVLGRFTRSVREGPLDWAFLRNDRPVKSVRGGLTGAVAVRYIRQTTPKPARGSVLILAPTLALLLSSPLLAQSPAPTPVQAGADIAAFHTVADSTMSEGDSLAAWVEFVVRFPRSPLAEIALASCLDHGADVAALLARLAPVDRAFLVTSYRTHHDALVANPPEGPLLTDVEPDAEPATSRPTRRRARRP